MKKEYLYLSVAVVLALLAISLVLGRRFWNAVEEEAAAKQEKVSSAPGEIGDWRELLKRKPVLAPSTGTATPNARHWGTESTESSQELKERLLGKLSSGDEDEVATAISLADMLETPELLEFTKAALERVQDPGFRRDLVGNLTGLVDRKVLPILFQVMEDEDSGVRTEALTALGRFDFVRQKELERLQKENDEAAKTQELSEEEQQKMASVVASAMNDKSTSVREESLKILRDLPGAVQYAGLRAAVDSNYATVRRNAVSLLKLSQSKDALELVFHALDDPDGTVHESAMRYVKHYLDQEFSSERDALAWWKENASHYDDELQEIDGEE